MNDVLQTKWDAFKSNVNWVLPHHLDIKRLNEFFSEAHLQGQAVGQELIELFFPEPDEDSPKYKYWEWVVLKADYAGDLLPIYDSYRAAK